MSDFDSQLDQFLDRLRSGATRTEDVAEMEAMLSADVDLRRRYRSRMRMESHLSSALQVVRKDLVPPFEVQPVKPSGGFSWRLPLVASVGLAAGLAVALFVWIQGLGPRTVATLESMSKAAWTSPVNVTEGSKLAPGEVRLVSGIAEIRFDSGALVSLEAPVHFEIESSMRCRLIEGRASVHAPDSAKGFVIATEYGYIVDHGTRFSIFVKGGEADVEVYEGEVTVHHEKTGQSLRLHENEASALTDAAVRPLAELPSSQVARPTSGSIIVGTGGHETSVILSDGNIQELNRRLLMAKLPNKRADAKWARRSLFSMPLKAVPPSRVKTARLRLNLVPSESGFAADLPEVIQFRVYGIMDESRETFLTKGLKWGDAPGCVAGFESEVDLNTVRPVAEFKISRGQQSGSIVVESDAMTEFIQADTTGIVSFMILRETRELRGQGLVHAFASSLHPEASGPTLEIIEVD